MAAPSERPPITAAQFCADLPLTEESLQLATEEISPYDFVNRLIEAERWVDAVQVLARMMPVRESVWWATQCAANGSGPETRAQEMHALRAAEAWVSEMTEESRYAAYEAAQKARLGSPGNCVAMAAFVAGPSLAPRDVDPVPPAPDLAPQMVAGTIMAASLIGGYEQSPAKLRYFLQQGLALYTQLAASAA